MPQNAGGKNILIKVTQIQKREGWSETEVINPKSLNKKFIFQLSRMFNNILHKDDNLQVNASKTVVYMHNCSIFLTKVTRHISGVT